MKQILLTLFFLSLFVFQDKVSGQSVIYFDFVTHNEETSSWNNTPYYTSNRARLIQVANYFEARGITWNLQSDWVYLTNVLTQETSPLMASTNNKNILRWLTEDKGVEIDPHAHESQYIYPDVVKLMDSVGLPESKIIGGTIYNANNGMNIWTNLVNGQYGIIFPLHFWKPEYMMGGGTPNHVADLKYFGIWNPQSPSSYLTQDTATHLRHIGVGCEMKIRDTTTVMYFVSNLHELVQNVQTGIYPVNGFYLQSIFFEQGDLNNVSFYNKVLQIADSVDAIVNAGGAEWKTLKQAYTSWVNDFDSTMFQWECGQVLTRIQESTTEDFSIYPNPATGMIRVEHEMIMGANLIVLNILGERVLDSQVTGLNFDFDTSALPAGLYVFQVINDKSQIVGSKKILIR